MIWSSEELREALGVSVHEATAGNKIQINSKSVEAGDIFIAMKSEAGRNNLDGHEFVSDALEQGAAVCVVSKHLQGLPAHQVIHVPDTYEALSQLACYKRRKSSAKFIAVTGSIGKTSTKDALQIVLTHFGPTFASRGNFNNSIGLRINLASLPQETKLAVLELGMNHSGEIRELVALARPDISVITNVSEAHLESFGSVSDIADAKCEIFEGMCPSKGIAIVNTDCQYYPRVLENLTRQGISKVFTFGRKEAHSCLDAWEPSPTSETVHLVYTVSGGTVDLTVPFLPLHIALNFTIPLLIVSILGLDLGAAAVQLQKFELGDGRGRRVSVTAKNGTEFSVLCDYYNASPASMRAALTSLKSIDHPRKVAILGDMLELGELGAELHRSMAEYCVAAGTTKAFLVGPNSRHIYEALVRNTRVKIQTQHFDNVDELLKRLSNLLEGDELILIKGSRGMKLEQILHYLQNQYFI